MNIEIRDAEAMRTIRALDAALYLRSTGWERQEVSQGQGTLWLCTVEGREFEALLPMNPELRDYALRMGDLLSVLSAVEKRSPWQVYSDLLTITSDVMRIRISDPELTDGTLPIEEHAQIAQKARDLVLAAACAATERRAVWHTRKPTQATEHVRKVRIGQSERGSYIVTVISRITPQLHSQLDFSNEAPPYDRQVTQLLAESLQALAGAAEKAALTQEMAAFDEAVPQGVNANLCDAVAGLWGGDEMERNLDFSFSWSPTRLTTAPRRVLFSSDRMPVIREAGRVMREQAPTPDFEVLGAVVKLERPEGSPMGRITVARYGDEGPRRVTLELGDPGYHTALEAHGQGKTIRASGTLVKDGRSFILRNSQILGLQDE